MSTDNKTLDDGPDIGIAYPALEEDRVMMQELISSFGVGELSFGPPVPGSLVRKCHDCGVPLLVGPKLIAKEAALLLVCPLHGVIRMQKARAAGGDPVIVSLAKPEN